MQRKMEKPREKDNTNSRRTCPSVGQEEETERARATGSEGQTNEKDVRSVSGLYSFSAESENKKKGGLVGGH